jgi:hypothetical protein
MSQSIVTKPVPQKVLPAGKSIRLAERQQYADFAVSHSEPVYREVLADLYRFWHETNQSFFHGRLNKPHLTIGQTPPRCLGFTRLFTDWGGDIQITIAESVVLGSHRVVVNRWPAEGAKRFVRDVVLHETIHQFQREIGGNAELAYRGHGPEFTKLCNQIGAKLDLVPVMPRRRGRKDSEKPTANYWPHNVRPAGYYSPDIDLGGVARKLEKPRHCSNCSQCLENLLAYLEERGTEETRKFLQKQLDWQRARRPGGCGTSSCNPTWIDASDEDCR